MNTAAVSAAFPPDAADPDASNDTAQAGFTVKAVVIAPRLAKGEVRDSLAALPPSGDRHTDKSILRAIEEIDKSLDPIRWIDDSTLDPDKGLQVFDREAKAVRELIKVVDKSGPLAGDAQTAVDTLVEIDRRLAQLAIDAAVAGGGDPKDINKANENMAKALSEFDKGHFDHAIKNYRNAWKDARNALRP
ncbi:MAG: hypothetical protein IIA44_12715 [Acidobacteria bacterium]|nr:hypothetical protein [Acidobacteriota bacterium]